MSVFDIVYTVLLFIVAGSVVAVIIGQFETNKLARRRTEAIDRKTESLNRLRETLEHVIVKGSNGTGPSGLESGSPEDPE